jgi:hypothetical protein
MADPLFSVYGPVREPTPEYRGSDISMFPKPEKLTVYLDINEVGG